MPFCSKCGAKNMDDSMFCIGCGTSLHVQQIVSNNIQLNLQQGTRQSSLAEIDRMISYFSQKQAQYDEYDNCIEQLAYYSKPNAVIKLSGEKKYSKKHLIFIGISLMVFGIAILLPIVMTITELNIENGNNPPILGWIFTLLILGGGIFLLIMGINGQIEYNRFYHENKAREKAEKERLIKYYENRCNQLVEELDNHFKSYGYCAVAESYTNPRILKEIREPIYIGRADTIKESMNLLVQDAHNTEMELQAAATARSAKSAARGANVAAFFTAASFINNLRN